MLDNNSVLNNAVSIGSFSSKNESCKFETRVTIAISWSFTGSFYTLPSHYLTILRTDFSVDALLLLQRVSR